MIKKFLGIGVVAVIIVFLTLGVLRSQQTEEVKSIKKIQREEGVPVLAEPATRSNVYQTQSFYGDLRSMGEIEVPTKLGDRVVKLYVDAGDWVEEGQLLFELDTTSSQSAVYQQRLAANDAEADYNRMKALLESGAISQQNFEKTKMAWLIAAENLRSAQSMVRATAPKAGRVSLVSIQEGQVPAPGEVALTILTQQRLEVTFNVSSEDRKNLRVGQTVQVRLSSEAHGGVAGKITEVSISTASGSRLFPVKAVIPATEGFHSGMLVVVDVTVDSKDDVIAVPQEAVLDRGDGPFLVVIDNGHATFQDVNLGLRGGQDVEVIAGLNEGQTIAIYGHATLQEGDKVKIVSENGKG